MSEMERNKGKLYPTNAGLDFIVYTIIGANLNDFGDGNLYKDKLDCVQQEGFEYGYEVINGKVYTVDWEVQRESDDVGFVDVKENTDGSISFHTYHYNGGGHWTEVVESALN